MDPSIPSAVPPTSTAALYVGNLHPDVTEAILFEKFTTAGPVVSIRVCRDMISRRSLGYAYVNFQNAADAERALDIMNFDMLKGRSIRIMWSQRDPTLRKSGVGNIFMKNLDKAIDNKALFDTFSAFGNILSCKVATDEAGNSKGYGFVHYGSEEAALQAIDKVNGMLLNGRRVFVGKFIPRQEREQGRGQRVPRFSNVYVKNFDEDLDDAKLKELFGRFGTITSAKVMTNEEGHSKGFGFVAFESPESAEAAVNELNNSTLNDRTLFVGPAVPKNKRLVELRKRQETVRAEWQRRFHGVNLYVKNLDDTIDDDRLRREFSPFGTITSSRVMIENGRSKGFGFVCYALPEEATKAVTEMNGRIVGSKPLYVALAQRKEERRAYLASQYMQRMATLRLQHMVPSLVNPGPRPFRPSMPGSIVGAAPPSTFLPPVIPTTAYTPVGWSNVPEALPSRPQVPPMPGLVPQGPPVSRPAFIPHPGRPTFRAQYPPGMVIPQAPGAPRPMPASVSASAPPSSVPQPPERSFAGSTGPVGFRAAEDTPTREEEDTVLLPGHQVLTPAQISMMTVNTPRRLIGDTLFVAIRRIEPEKAGKITGMLLELETLEVIQMLQNPSVLAAKVAEALAVLKRTEESRARKAANEAELNGGQRSRTDLSSSV